MPQRAAHLPLLTSFQRQASIVLAAVTTEIHQREDELAALKAEAARWQSALQAPADGNGSTAPARRRRSAQRRRLDWNAILKELPARFTTKDIAQKGGRPIAHAYTYVSRWMKAKRMKRAIKKSCRRSKLSSPPRSNTLGLRCGVPHPAAGAGFAGLLPEMRQVLPARKGQAGIPQWLGPLVCWSERGAVIRRISCKKYATGSPISLASSC